MSSDLPEDLSRWPSNPYLLLGVSFGIEPRELRRVYTQLIRVWKPEQYPEHFRRIREAYEAVLGQSEFMERQPAPESDTPTEATSSFPVSNAAKPLPNPQYDLLNEIDEQWQLACAGQESQVYRRLVELQGRTQQQYDIFPRLYWLLALFPQLDQQRSPCDWLVAGLRHNGMTGPARELYRRELTYRPEEVLRDSGAELLDLPVRPALLAELSEWRWQAAGRLGRWQVIATDLDRLRARLRDDEETWGRLLFSALDQLVWMPGGQARELASRCGREVKQLPPLDPQWTAALDRLEFLMALSAAWRWKLDAHAFPELFRLVPVAWTRPFTEIRPLLISLVQEIATNALSVLAKFDRISKEAGVVLAYFGQLLDTLQTTLPSLRRDHRPSGGILPRLFLSRATLRKSAASRFARVAGWLFQLEETAGSSNYLRFREDVLAFCLSEGIYPEQVADALQDQPKYWLAAQEDLSALLRNDWPLRHVCRAHQLFWAG